MSKFKLHRKVKGAVIATVLVLIADGFEQATNIFPNNPALTAVGYVLPAIVAYLVKAEKATEVDDPAEVIPEVAALASEPDLFKPSNKTVYP